MLGAHISFATPMSDIPMNAKAMGLNTFQIFTRNARNMKQRYISDYEINAFNTALLQSDISTFVIHAPYSMNPSSPERAKLDSAVRIINEDMQFMSKLAGNKLYVLHPGSHMGYGEDVGLENLTETLHRLDKITATICVETMSGAGTEMLSADEAMFKMLRANMDLDVQLTFDTCHVFSAGIDILNLYNRIAPWCGVVHINDSKYDFGTYHDRHENLQQGYIPFTTIATLVPIVHPKVPVILETPVDGMAKDISLLKLYAS